MRNPPTKKGGEVAFSIQIGRFVNQAPFRDQLLTFPKERLLHEDDLLRCFRNSVSVTYVSTLPSPSSSAPI